MNMGTVILENHDVFGNAVNIVSRVQAIPLPEHIYITQRLYDEVKSNKEMQFRFIGHEQLKGVKDKTPIYKTAPVERMIMGPTCSKTFQMQSSR